MNPKEKRELGIQIVDQGAKLVSVGLDFANGDLPDEEVEKWVINPMKAIVEKWEEKRSTTKKGTNTS